MGMRLRSSLRRGWSLLIAYILLSTLLLAVSLSEVSSKGRTFDRVPFYEARGGVICRDGRPINLFGLSWFGFETCDYVVHGLWARNWRELLRQVKELGFNAIRIPFCAASIHGAEPAGIDYELNPDLEGLNSLEIMEKMIAGAEELGIYIVLNYHRVHCGSLEELWYTDDYPEENVIEDWVFLAERFGRYSNVVGADIRCEPHGEAGWGTGDPSNDFRLYVERVGEAILEKAPHWLIFVEGVEYTHTKLDDENPYPCFWGENLMGVGEDPVRLPEGKVVYAPHVFGPDVYMQSYFEDPEFPDNMPEIWELHWGYLVDGGYTLVVGSFGGRYGEGSLDRLWHDKLVEYLIDKGVCNFFYWCLNPNSDDTGGILLDDWGSVDWDKVYMLRRLIDAAKNGYTLSNLESLFVSGGVFNATIVYGDSRPHGLSTALVQWTWWEGPVLHKRSLHGLWKLSRGTCWILRCTTSRSASSYQSIGGRS